MTLPLTDHARAGDRLRWIRDYYACFNERRFQDAAAMFAEDAVLEQMPFLQRLRGGSAYHVFAETWTRAFPDATVTIEGLVEAPSGVFEVDLVGTGTHEGELKFGGSVFKATGIRTTLHLRELLEMRDGRITLSCVSFDFQELVQQLARVDEGQLLSHLSRIRVLEEQLRALAPGHADRRGLIERLGRELDAARGVVRPYFMK